MYYIYGVTGIEGFEYVDTYYPETYYFDKNTLGDVVAIRDENGNILAKYEYDAWGNVTVYDQYGNVNTNSTFIGNVNPIRYRGYYYDTETGFYYLQTRYYDPTICRFINADNYELVATLASRGGLNMYSYCANNPIMYTDETGEFWWIIAVVVLAAGAIGGGIYAGVQSYQEGNRGWELVFDITEGAGAGLAIVGGAMATVAIFIVVGWGGIQSGVPLGLQQIISLGFVGFNFGTFLLGALNGIQSPDPLEMPPQTQPPIYYNAIGGS